MGTNSDGCASLTAQHGCKCLPDESITVEDCLIAISSEVGARIIVPASSGCCFFERSLFGSAFS